MRAIGRARRWTVLRAFVIVLPTVYGPLKEGRKRLADLRRGPFHMVASATEPAKVVVQQVRGNITHIPAGTDCFPMPNPVLRAPLAVE